MARRMLRVRVKPTTYRRKGKLIRRKGYTYKRPDIGALGRGRKVIPRLRGGLMTKEAINLGLLKPGERVSDLTKAEIGRLAEHLREKYGQRRSAGMFRAILVFRKRFPDSVKEKFEYGFKVATGEPGVWD